MTVFVVFLFLAVYNAGCMTTLQIQHYGIYPAVGKENFAAYMQANNRAAVLPTILPAMLLLLVSLALVFSHPGFMRTYEAVGALGLNLVAFASTMVWQRRIHAEMATTGYDEQKVSTLIQTNWIRTSAHLLIAAVAIIILLRMVAASPR